MTCVSRPIRVANGNEAQQGERQKENGDKKKREEKNRSYGLGPKRTTDNGLY